MSKIEDKMCEFGIEEMPREFLAKLIENHPEMKMNIVNEKNGECKSISIDNLTDDECRQILKFLFQELKARENIQ
jgi:hypothetical protein